MLEALGHSPCLSGSSILAGISAFQAHWGSIQLIRACVLGLHYPLSPLGPHSYSSPECQQAHQSPVAHWGTSSMLAVASKPIGASLSQLSGAPQSSSEL